MMTTETATYGDMTTEQHEAFRRWLITNDYAESPDRFGYNNGCHEHPKQGKIYAYRNGGYYRCFQCVVREYGATLT